jgi:hypothetical protein
VSRNFDEEQALPRALSVGLDGNLHVAHPGMSLRDYAAIEAGAKLFAVYSLSMIDSGLCDKIAQASFVFADSIIAAREAKP